MPSATTTAPGSASACSRAARFGVSPTTARSRASPSPIRSPTTTEPGRDPDPRGERLARRRGDAGHGRGDGEAGPDRALGLVLVRPGPAEIGEHAVAHELGDVALEARDLARDGVLVGADDLAHLLGIEPARERGRADQVDEHHRQLPPLGLRRPCAIGATPARAAPAEATASAGRQGPGSP